MKEWYIAKSEVNRENWLISTLTSLGADVYYPYINVSRRGKQVSEPLLPTYVFCHIEVDGGEWWSSLHSPGLDCFLGENGRPTSLAGEVVRQIRIQVEKRNAETTTSGQPDSQQGCEDQLNGLEKVFRTGANARQRCRAFFQAIGGLAPVEVDPGYMGSPRTNT